MFPIHIPRVLELSFLLAILAPALASAMPMIFHESKPFGAAPPAGATLTNARLVLVAPGLLLGKADHEVRPVSGHAGDGAPQLGRSYYFQFSGCFTRGDRIYLRSVEGHVGLIGTRGSIAIDEPWIQPYEVEISHTAHLSTGAGGMRIVSEIETDVEPVLQNAAR